MFQEDCSPQAHHEQKPYHEQFNTPLGGLKWNLSLYALQNGIKGNSLHVLMYLLTRYNQKTGLSWPSLTTIGKDLGFSRKGTSDCINRLKKAGLIHVTQGDRVSSNQYRPAFELVDDWSPGWCDPKRGGEVNYTRVVKSTSPGVVKQSSPGVVKSTSPEPSSSEPISNEPTSPNRWGVGGVISPSFLEEEEEIPLKEEEKDQAEGGCSREAEGQPLTKEQSEYIDLSMKLGAKNGTIKSPKWYRDKLEKLARNGKLETDDLEKLRGDLEKLREEERKAALAQVFQDLDEDQLRDLVQAVNEGQERELQGQTYSPNQLQEGLKHAFPGIIRRVNNQIRREKLAQELQDYIDQKKEEGFTGQDLFNRVIWYARFEREDDRPVYLGEPDESLITFDDFAREELEKVDKNCAHKASVKANKVFHLQLSKKMNFKVGRPQELINELADCDWELAEEWQFELDSTLKHAA